MKMKRIILILLISTAFASCKGFLEVEPTNVLTVKTYDDVKALLGAHLRSYKENTSLQGTLPAHYNHALHLQFNFYADDLLPDKYLEVYPGRNNRGLFRQCMNWAQMDFPGSIWSYHFENIGYFNTIIGELSKIKDIDKAKAEIVLGEAKMLRAWELFKLLQYFVPYNNGDEYGLPYNLNSDQVGEYSKERKTVSQTYKTIIDELEEVLSYTTPPRESYNIFYDKNIINALLAQVYHHKGGSCCGTKEDYTRAITHAKAAMKAGVLETPETYKRYAERSQSGIAKDLKHCLLIDYRYTSFGMAGLVAIPNYGMYQFATNELYNLYSNDDVRKTYFFTADKGIIKFNKFNYSNYYMIELFTMAEMQLIIAESYSRVGDATNAKIEFEKFLQSRIKNFTAYTGTNILEDIQNERRKEFCFEYDMRWCDLTRIQKGWSRGSQDPNVVETYTLKDKDYKFCFPIPLLQELQYNKIPQNPGWPSL